MKEERLVEDEAKLAHLSECTDAELTAWNECIRSAIFSDLIALRELDKDVFAELFYGRSNETDQFCESLDVFCKTGRNYLIVGEAGIGKSSFLYKIFLNENHELHKYVYPIFIDFRKGSVSRDAALINFIDKIDGYFSAVKFPLNTMEKPKEAGTIDYNLIKISEHFGEYDANENHKCLLLLVDDLDYADDFWLEFLLAIHNLVASPKISFVLSVRPLLEYKIRTENDVLYRDIVRNTKRIDLGPLAIRKILYKRLAPLIKESAEAPFHTYIKRLFRRDSAICRILRKQYGIKNLEQLARFEFPFTGRLLTFMTEITNGNNREVFDIAEAVLRYIFTHAKELETRIEDGETKYIVPREAILSLFSIDEGGDQSNYRLFNLNEKYSVSKDGNKCSLHYNVLEMVKYVGVIDNEAIKILEQHGHVKDSVLRSLSVMEDRTHRLIVPIRSNESLKGARHVMLETEYKITMKGDKYLEMVEFDPSWECYPDKFGKPGPSIRRFL
ncbi:MAG: ATP-binding protein [Chromatiales bacterium]|nr:ATP-binding protein [Chromatiales bacterium]